MTASSQRVPTWTDRRIEAMRPPYRSARVRARFAIAGLSVAALVSAASSVHYASFSGLLDRLAAGINGDAEARGFDAISSWLTILDLAVLAMSGIAVLAWLSRSVANLEALDAGPALVTPRWSIGWWFVPIANLFMVPRIVLDVGQRVEVARLALFQVGVMAWWLAWVSAWSFQPFAFIPPAPTIADLQRSALVHEATDLMRLFAALLLVGLIRAIQGAADRRAAEVREGPSGAGARTGPPALV